MEYWKFIQGYPPQELLENFEQIQIFKTERLAKKLWDIGEKILREENLWKVLFQPETALFYQPSLNEFYKIGHEREDFMIHKINFCYMQIKDNLPKLINIFIAKYKNQINLDEGKSFAELIDNFFNGILAYVHIRDSEKEETYSIFKNEL